MRSALRAIAASGRPLSADEVVALTGPRPLGEAVSDLAALEAAGLVSAASGSLVPGTASYALSADGWAELRRASER